MRNNGLKDGKKENLPFLFKLADMKVQNSMFLQWIWVRYGSIRSMTAQNTDSSLFAVIDRVGKEIYVNNHLSSTGIFLFSICSFLQRNVKQ